MKKALKKFTVFASLALSACSQLQYQPVSTISHIDLSRGYRLENNTENPRSHDELFLILLISGGGSRAASFGYGVLEALKTQHIRINGEMSRLIDEVDIVSGVSGGSVLATYFAMHGADAIPSFEKRFLSQNFQSQLISQVFSFANMPRLTSSQFGRGDLLQEQFEQTLFGNATFGDLEHKRKGPFALISATDMTQGVKVNFNQEFFDLLCLNLSDMRLARAVAASSSVPVLFSPLTLNNNSGNCGYNIHSRLAQFKSKGSNATEERIKNLEQNAQYYINSQQRPYIHLVDGGLTDNLGLGTLIQVSQLSNQEDLYQRLNRGKASKIILLSVNAQSQTATNIDQSADVPGLSDALNAVINIPIDKVSATSIAATHKFVEEWNKANIRNNRGKKVNMYFINLEMKDLQDSVLRDKVLNISTSFYLPKSDVDNLRQAAKTLLQQSKPYLQLLSELR